MAPSDYAALFGWAAAAFVLNAGAAVGVGRGWVRAGGKVQAVGMILVVLLLQRAFPTSRRSMEASARTLKDEAYFWLPIIAACVLGLVVNAFVEAARRRRMRERMQPLVPARRYFERRRA
ncbi:hypothetical protein EJB05_49186 [Eragrostis curvula]|uniref:Uncharacterized protein n=1 Tax=Eragrostis curvula TaxID=38414 RepID=A0A5J9T3K4_9POAL|nr:hypothetical protein EJB05_53915 [Eragrostis curvula]TVU05999.1 hypothetical protein EJB05_49186 [Eragrostis curvula]